MRFLIEFRIFWICNFAPLGKDYISKLYAEADSDLRVEVLSGTVLQELQIRLSKSILRVIFSLSQKFSSLILPNIIQRNRQKITLTSKSAIISPSQSLHSISFSSIKAKQIKSKQKNKPRTQNLFGLLNLSFMHGKLVSILFFYNFLIEPPHIRKHVKMLINLLYASFIDYCVC